MGSLMEYLLAFLLGLAWWSWCVPKHHSFFHWSGQGCGQGHTRTEWVCTGYMHISFEHGFRPLFFYVMYLFLCVYFFGPKFFWLLLGRGAWDIYLFLICGKFKQLQFKWLLNESNKGNRKTDLAHITRNTTTEIWIAFANCHQAGE